MIKSTQIRNIFSKLILIAASSTYSNITYAQTTTNSSSLSNTAAPSASSVTTGGTNINYQTNNAYNNEVGFGPGIFCRTPTIYLGNHSKSLAFNMGVLYPFGSSALADCKSLVKTIARDREISSQLSMIKACHDLYNKGIKVNSEIYPLLSSCEKYADHMKSKKEVESSDILKPKADISLRLQPKTKRML